MTAVIPTLIAQALVHPYTAELRWGGYDVASRLYHWPAPGLKVPEIPQRVDLDEERRPVLQA